MKNIVVIYNGDDWYKDVPFRDASKQTRLSFEDWYMRAERYDIKFYRASINWFDDEITAFTKAWTYENGRWIKIDNPIVPDAIYDKTAGKYDYKLFDRKMAIARKVPIYNHPLFRTITNNKLSQYMLFSAHMPATILASNAAEVRSALEQMSGSQTVIKPLHGSGGFGIFIGAKKDVNTASLPYPVIVQEFIVSTKGIPGFSQRDEVADLRLIYTDHKLVYALSRIAAEGSLFTNFHQGARAVLVPDENIPSRVMEMARDITQTLKTFPHAHYSLDFIFDDNGRPFLVEMNTTPGFDLLHIVGTEDIKERNFEAFAASIGSVLHSK